MPLPVLQASSSVTNLGAPHSAGGGAALAGAHALAHRCTPSSPHAHSSPPMATGVAGRPLLNIRSQPSSPMSRPLSANFGRSSPDDLQSVGMPPLGRSGMGVGLGAGSAPTFPSPRVAGGMVGAPRDLRALIELSERDWYSMNDLYSSSGSRRRERKSAAQHVGDMTHTQRGGLLMGMHPSQPRRQAPGGATEVLAGRTVASPAMPSRPSSRDDMSPQRHREMALMQELRLKQEEMRMLQEASRREREALMKEVRLQQEDNKQLRETVQRLSIELRLCTMVVQEVSSLMGGNHTLMRASADTVMDSEGLKDAVCCADAAQEMAARHSDEAGQGHDGTLARTGKPQSDSRPSPVLPDREKKEDGHVAPCDIAPGGEDKPDALLKSATRQNALAMLPLSPYSQPWTCMTWTLQTLGRQLMHSMLDSDIEHFCERNRHRVAKLAKYRAYALSKVQAAAASVWPRAVCKIFGSVSTGLSVPSSDVDIIVCLPKVLSRESEPSLARADVMQGRHVIKGGNLANLAQFLHNADWVQSETLKTIETSLVPVIQFTTRQITLPHSLRGEVREKGETECSSSPVSEAAAASSLEPHEGSVAAFHRAMSFKHNALADSEGFIKIDVTFEGPNHRGLAAVDLVRSLMLVSCISCRVLYS